MMVLCGVVLAAAILFNTTTVSILERRRELATIRAMGERMGGIARLVAVENAAIAGGGLLVGLPVSLVALRFFLRLFRSDLFGMPFWVAPRTLLLARWPALRAVARTDRAAAVTARQCGIARRATPARTNPLYEERVVIPIRCDDALK